MRARQAGVYTLTAVATAPVETPHTVTVDVYNFGDTARRVTLTARPVGGGWTVRAEQETRIRVPAGGRVGVNFTLLASSSVARRTDRRPAFRATLDDRSEIPASVALIHLR
ncbi:hypothetical protein GCM10010228_53140 [Streptomyces massasporeus]|nr:hypothetical protein GCM10010228_53140 [Streptomyces massasporeus]